MRINFVLPVAGMAKRMKVGIQATGRGVGRRLTSIWGIIWLGTWIRLAIHPIPPTPILIPTHIRTATIKLGPSTTMMTTIEAGARSTLAISRFLFRQEDIAPSACRRPCRWKRSPPRRRESSLLIIGRMSGIDGKNGQDLCSCLTNFFDPFLLFCAFAHLYSLFALPLLTITSATTLFQPRPLRFHQHITSRHLVISPCSRPHRNSGSIPSVLFTPTHPLTLSHYIVSSVLLATYSADFLL